MGSAIRRDSADHLYCNRGAGSSRTVDDRHFLRVALYAQGAVPHDFDTVPLPGPSVHRVTHGTGTYLVWNSDVSLVVVADDETQLELVAPLRITKQVGMQRQIPVRQADRIDVSTVERPERWKSDISVGVRWSLAKA